MEGDYYLKYDPKEALSWYLEAVTLFGLEYGEVKDSLTKILKSLGWQGEYEFLDEVATFLTIGEKFYEARDWKYAFCAYSYLLRINPNLGIPLLRTEYMMKRNLIPSDLRLKLEKRLPPKIYEMVTKSYPVSYSSNYSAADSDFRNCDIDTIIVSISNALKLEEYPILHFVLGKAYLFKGENTDTLLMAEQELRKAIGSSSDDKDLKNKAYTSLGFVYLNLSDYEKALQSLDSATVYNKNDADAYLGLAAAYFGLNEERKGEKILQKYTKAKFDSKNAKANLEVGEFYYSKTRCSQAANYLIKAFKLDPNGWIGKKARNLFEDLRKKCPMLPRI